MTTEHNERRREHTPHERAPAIRRRIEDFGWSQAQAAEQPGISRSAVAMALVSLYDLPADLREQAEKKQNKRREK